MRMLLIAALLCGCGGEERDEPQASVAGKGGAAGSASSAGNGGAAGASGAAGAEESADCGAFEVVCRSDCGGCEKHCAPKVDSITRWLAPCAAGCDFGEAKECALISVGTEEAERCTFACEGETYTNRCDLIGGSCEPGGLCELFQ
jgi:hypothetical protein